jgi:hypothetical protein
MAGKVDRLWRLDVKGSLVVDAHDSPDTTQAQRERKT